MTDGGLSEKDASPPTDRLTRARSPSLPRPQAAAIKVPWGYTGGRWGKEERKATHPWGHLAFLQCPPRGVLPGSQGLTLRRSCSRTESKLQLLKGQVPFSAVVLGTLDLSFSNQFPTLSRGS